MNVVLKPSYQIQWDEEMVKNHLIKPILKAMYGKKSTTQMTTDEVNKVHERLMLALTAKWEDLDYVDFPSVETTESYYESFK